MFGQTFSEDLGRIGQFVKESHCKIKIRLSCAIGGISTCRSGIELLENMFPKIISWCFGLSRTPLCVFGRETCENPNLAAVRAFSDCYMTCIPRGARYRSKHHAKYYGILCVIMRQSSSGPKTNPRPEVSRFFENPGIPVSPLMHENRILFFNLRSLAVWSVLGISVRGPVRGGSGPDPKIGS